MAKNINNIVSGKHLIWIYCLFFLLSNSSVSLAVVERNIDPVGSIIVAKGQEQLRMAHEIQWIKAEVTQTLTAGDALKTGRYGGLAILFSDETQIRIHNNSSLLIKDIAKKNQKNNTLLKLDFGKIWMRAISQPDKLQVDTPSASLAVRGTDWALSVDKSGQSQLVVLEGKIRFFNALGSIEVQRGEAAIAQIGQPPRKIFLISPADKPYWNLILTSEWVDLFLSSTKNLEQLKLRRETLTKQSAVSLSIKRLLELAEISYALSDLKASQHYLDEVDKIRIRGDTSFELKIKSLRGLIALRENKYLVAEQYFNVVSHSAERKYKLLAKSSLIAIFILQKQYDKAEKSLKVLELAQGNSSHISFLEIVLTSFRGDQKKAIEKTIQAQKVFLNDVRFYGLLAHLYLLEGDAEKMKQSIDQAMILDPDNAFIWHWLGLYYQGMQYNNHRAIDAYHKAIQLNPDSMASWHNLSVIYLSLSDYDEASNAIAKAIASSPTTAYPYATSALLMMFKGELDVAKIQLNKALKIDPSEPNVLYAMGVLNLLNGNIPEAIVWFEKSIVSNPNELNATIRLGEAFYEAGRVLDAQKSLQTVRRLDQNSPVPAMDLSLIAIDRAQAGDAIRYARESYKKYTQLGNADFSDNRNIQNSASVIELAYRQLQLNDWGNSYNQKSFSPYLPGGYYANSVQLDSDFARRSSLIQAQLIDPLSVSTRNRYYDFWRRPFNDLSVSVGLGDTDGAFTDTESLIFQGFSRPHPIAYYLNATRAHNDGFRDNSEFGLETIEVKLGTTLDEKNALTLNFFGSHNKNGLPGTTIEPTLNDNLEENFYEGSLGYRIRFSPTNYMLFRTSGGYARGVIKNPNALGQNLSSLESSLLNSFGLDLTQDFFKQGLCDITDIVKQLAGVDRPVFLIDHRVPILDGFINSCFLADRNILQSSISNNLDTRVTKSLTRKETYFALQFRHMFDIRDFQLTYGAEWYPSNIETNREITNFQQNNGESASIGAIGNNNSFDIVSDFPFGQTQVTNVDDQFNRDAIMGYLKGRWTINPELWIESSLHYRYYKNERIDQGQWDPAIGVAYQINSKHWLRAVVQRGLYFDYHPDTVSLVSQQQGTIGPTTTVGISPSDIYLSDGSSSTDYILRWDAEWMSQLFTFVQFEERNINRFQNIIFNVDKARLRSVETGVNIWFAEQFSFSASYQFNDTENRTSSINQGKQLPLIAEHNLTASLNYINPAQVYASINQVYTSSRLADIENSERLEDFWATNLSLTWQPLDRHVLLNFSINNIFDKQPELIKNFPLPGRTFLFRIEGRY